MAFSDPQVLPLWSGDVSLPRIAFDGSTGVFQNDDGTARVTFTHTSGKRNRHVARLDYNVVVPDDLNPALNVPLSASFYLTVDVPKMGMDPDNIVGYIEALAKLLDLTETGNANLKKLLSGQS